MYSELEQHLRHKLKVSNSSQEPRRDRIRHLMAFWPHFALHKRVCDLSGKNIISPFSSTCQHPVWERSAWIEKANPPQAEYKFELLFFEQLAEHFRRCPIPHNIQVANENCEYTDDWWHSKNCYLSHSGVTSEDCRYCYRILGNKDCQSCVYSWDCQLSLDLINSRNCYHVAWALHSRNCRDSAFLFDCRNCTDCLSCWNLRNKQYCYNNKQLSKNEFTHIWNSAQLSSWRKYATLSDSFAELIRQKAWWKALQNEQNEDCSGNYLDHCRNCQDSCGLSYSQDCVNVWRGHEARDVLDAVSPYKCELVFSSCLAQENCFDIRSSFNIVRSRHLEYCAHCYDCEHCFACCGLVRGRFCILNKVYKEQEYFELKKQICSKLDESAQRGLFFPAYFAATPYQESFAGALFPLSEKDQKEFGVNLMPPEETPSKNMNQAGDVPDNLDDLAADVTTKAFWDKEYGRAFRITPQDIEFTKASGFALPDRYYLGRIKSLFGLMYFPGELRRTTCALSARPIWTNLPQDLEARIISEESHRNLVVDDLL